MSVKIGSGYLVGTEMGLENKSVINIIQLKSGQKEKSKNLDE